MASWTKILHQAELWKKQEREREREREKVCVCWVCFPLKRFCSLQKKNFTESLLKCGEFSVAPVVMKCCLSSFFENININLCFSYPHFTREAPLLHSAPWATKATHWSSYTLLVSLPKFLGQIKPVKCTRPCTPIDVM